MSHSDSNPHADEQGNGHTNKYTYAYKYSDSCHL